LFKRSAFLSGDPGACRIDGLCYSSFSLWQKICCVAYPGRMREIKALAGIRRQLSGTFFKNVAVVASGTAVSQVINVAFSPVLSRLYGPDEFGVFATYTSVLGVLSATATLNYADPIMLPKEDREAAPLLALACAASLCLSILTCVFLAIVPTEWMRSAGLDHLGWFAWLLPASVLIAGSTHAVTSWCIRQQAFHRTSQSQVLRSLTVCAGQTAGAATSLGGGGLIGAGLIGDLIALAFLGRAALAKSLQVIKESARWPLLLKQGREFKEFPIYGAPQNIMNALSQGLPVLLLTRYYGISVAGYYAFGMRVLQVPSHFVLTSIRQVLFQKLSYKHAHGQDITRPYFRATASLFGIAIGPAIIAFFAAPWLFGLVFGSEWKVAGEYGRWLLVWLLPAFCNVPSSICARILRLQRSLFIFDAVLLGARTLALVAGGLWLPAMQTIILIAVVGGVFNAGLILYIANKVRHSRLDRP